MNKIENPIDHDFFDVNVICTYIPEYPNKK